MTIDDVVEKARKRAIDKRADADWKWIHGRLNSDKEIKAAENLERLAEWLEELKMYKSLVPRELVSEKQKNDRAMEYSKGFDYGFKTGYANAIDDFAEKVKEMYAFTILEEEQLNEIEIGRAHV